MTEMIERVAKAVLPFSEFNSQDDWADTEAQDWCRSVARAAIEAMRDPTVEMVSDGDDVAERECYVRDDMAVWSFEASAAVWRSMIDKSLTQ